MLSKNSHVVASTLAFSSEEEPLGLTILSKKARFGQAC